MSVNCDVILEQNATPEQLTALGKAFWSWCVRAAGASGIYQYLDDQTLADLIAGRFPSPDEGTKQVQGGFRFQVQDHVSGDQQLTIAGLRYAIPTRGVKDILVAGRSWNRTE